MMFLHSGLFVLALFVQGFGLVSARPLEGNAGTSDAKELAFVKLRIEGAQKTIFEGRVLTYGHNITTASGGTHKCDGTNHNANPKPGATCTTALSDAARKHGFNFDGTFDTEFEDYFITSIGGDVQTTTQFWGVLLNYKFTPVGGCQAKVTSSDDVLWAFDAFSKEHFLKLEAPLTVKKGASARLRVTDGTTGAPLSSAKVNKISGPGAATVVGTSAEDGTISVAFSDAGIYTLKASRDDSIRSNGAILVVTL
ncbi:hypothetical protein AAF712_005199 [Marasmius tenuissimus]|uniref:Uncharacterized protein n=1 Tax=Marasmius tenuissimus TaxID=585030 RepID=A0ABR3A330_9AGAR